MAWKRKLDQVEKVDEALVRADTFKSWSRRKYIGSYSREKLEETCIFVKNLNERFQRKIVSKEEFRRCKYMLLRLDNHMIDPITIVEYKQFIKELDSILLAFLEKGGPVTKNIVHDIAPPEVWFRLKDAMDGY